MAINSTAIWRIRPSGSNTNGGAYDPGISGAATDYSQFNAAQASGTAGTATGTTTFTDVVANAFTSAMIGNALHIAGTGLTTGWYFCTGFTSSSAITIDRSPGTGTTGAWFLGGGLADLTVFESTGPMVPGNIVYLLGSGVPNPASYVYDYNAPATVSSPSGNTTAGYIYLIGDPNTPSGGVPCIKTGSCWFNGGGSIKLVNLYIVASSSTFPYVFGNGSGKFVTIINCVYDQFGFDVGLSGSTGGGITESTIVNTEIFSSVAKRTSNTNQAIQLFNSGTSGGGSGVYSCNIHDCIGPAINLAATNGAALLGNIIAKNGGYGILVNSIPPTIAGNTIDANIGNGVEVATQAELSQMVMYNNTISNHTTASTFGLKLDAGTAAANSLVQSFVDYNTYYGNTSDLSAIGYGAHDTSNSGAAPKLISSSPYVAQSTENYALASGVLGTTNALPGAPFPQHLSGQTTTVTNNSYPGAVQPAATGGSAGMLYVPGMSGGMEG